MFLSIRARLFLMMVLEYFVWGAWLPLIFAYLPSLGFTPGQQALILNAFPAAAVIGMFFSNQFADRNFAAERFLGASHLVGGLAMVALGFVHSFGLFFGLMLIHCLLYVPTLSIVNSIAFANMRDAQKEFGLVRMGGTIGWVLAAWPFTFILVDWAKVREAHPQGIVAWIGQVLDSGLTGAALQSGTRWTFFVAGVAALLLTLLSLTLPHTPPKRVVEEGKQLAWLEALRFLQRPFVLVLWIVAFLDSSVLNCYFNWAAVFLGSPQVGIAGNWIMPVMSIGQVAEVLTMLILGVTLKRLGWRATMIIGTLGHVVRFAVFAYLPDHQWLIILVNVLHGICYAFFFATVYIFVDAYFPKDARASAQGLFNVMILGLGVMAANTICPYLIHVVFQHDGVTDFRHLFMVAEICGMAAALLLAIFFHPPARTAESAEVA